jgi:ribosomal protein L11 methyltransferase
MMAADASDATVRAELRISAQTATLLSDALAERFAAGDAVVASFEDPNGDWTVEVHFAQAPDEAGLRAFVSDVAGEQAARALTLSRISERDWIAASLAGLHPVAAGRFVVHGAHDRSRVAANVIGIEIEAALAFGTGHHGTTRGCLLALDRVIKACRPRRILDIGTGTGVLAIAATRALRRSVLATDIDRDAVIVAKANARANRTGALVRAIRTARLRGSCFQRRRFDLVFANILLGPLKSIATPMARLLAPNARVILSGLLVNQVNAALAAYRAHGLALEWCIVLDGWVTLVLARRASLPRMNRGRRKI